MEKRYEILIRVVENCRTISSKYEGTLKELKEKFLSEASQSMGSLILPCKNIRALRDVLQESYKVVYRYSSAKPYVHYCEI